MSTAISAGLFSATQTEAVEQLARAGLRNAVRVCVDVAASNTHSQQHQQQQNKQQAPAPQPNSMQRTPSSLQIEYQTCDHTQKVQQLVSFIQVSLLLDPLKDKCLSEAGQRCYHYRRCKMQHVQDCRLRSLVHVAFCSILAALTTCSLLMKCAYLCLSSLQVLVL